MEDNGRVPFDKDRPHKTIDRDEADAMVRLLYEVDRRLWGELHYEAVTGERLSLRPPRKAKR